MYRFLLITLVLLLCSEAGWARDFLCHFYKGPRQGEWRYLADPEPLPFHREHREYCFEIAPREIAEQRDLLATIPRARLRVRTGRLQVIPETEMGAPATLPGQRTAP